MASVKGTRTEKNLLKSFAGESQARNRYSYFAKVAEKEGYPQIAQLFLETADNERVHAKKMFDFLEGGPVEITAIYPAGTVGTTRENLAAAAEGENEEYTALYPQFAAEAEEDGFKDVATMYRMIAKVEQWHEKRYLELLGNIDENTVFSKKQPVLWKCAKCGYVHEGTDALKTCPACKHPQKYFEVYAKNW